jgi:hypothetical protein
LNIEILNVARQTLPTKKGGSYDVLEVAFKNLDSGKVEGKKIMSFNHKPVFDALSKAQAGNKFDVKLVKEGDYWNWTQVTEGTGETSAKPTAKESFTSPKSTYETAEERAVRQRLIVRQSSISAAIGVLAPGSKGPLDPELVLDIADRFTDWVFERPVGVAGIVAMDDDVPL